MLKLALTLLFMTAFSLTPHQSLRDIQHMGQQHLQNFTATPFNDTTNLPRRIQWFVQNAGPRPEAEFQAMVYPFFLIGQSPNTYKVEYEYTFLGSRIDLLLISNVKNTSECVVIELKRNGNVTLALQQARQYGKKLAERSTYCKSVCWIGMNLKDQAIEWKGQYFGISALNMYNTRIGDIVQRVRRQFIEISRLLTN